MLSRQEWVQKINTRWQDTVDEILDVGDMLIKATQQLKGEFEAMVEQDLAFGPRTARMLKAVADHVVLSDRKHASALPLSWRTLYELTKVPLPVLEQAIEDGRIHPEMECQEVREFLPKDSPVFPALSSTRWTVSDQRPSLQPYPGTRAQQDCRSD
jgi:hypothetical protein